MKRITVLGREGEIRPYRDEDEPELLRLYVASFGTEGREKLGQRDWRYVQNPAGRHQTTVCALENGELIASYTSIPLRAILFGRPVRVAVVVDAMTHPAFRGAILGRKGVFVRTFQEWVDMYTGADGDRYRFGFGVPQRRHARLGQLLLKYRIWDEVGYYSREIEDTWIKRVRRRLPARVRRVGRFDLRADALWERLRGAYPFAVIRDTRYLQWRYDECPDREYLRFALEGRRGWEGWLVLSVDGDMVTVVDALLPPERPAQARALLYRALGEALERGATAMQGWACPGTPIERLLVDAGFRNAPFEGVCFAARVFDPGLDSAAVREGWYFQPGDSDDF